MKEFQFHKGTIRTKEGKEVQLPFSLFQFHKGTIRTDDSNVTPNHELHFNSIKVRLER